jgi:ribonuclease HI
VRHVRANPVYLLKDNLSAKFTIFTDGASRGNPGPAAIGAVIRDEKGNLAATISQCIGKTTNNQAEYTALIKALGKAKEIGARELTVCADSELLVYQIQGRYKVKNAGLRTLYQEVVKLIGGFDRVDFKCVPRERNAEADALANKALDGR